MAKNWEFELKDGYAKGNIKSFRVMMLAVAELSNLAPLIGTTHRTLKDKLASPEQFEFADAYNIAAFLKGEEHVTPADEKIILNLIHDYNVEMRGGGKRWPKKTGEKNEPGTEASGL
jgi:hypothetical protein